MIPRLSRSRLAVVVVLAVSVVALGGSPTFAATVDSRGPLAPLPATFTGLLPCAECEGIRYQIDLLPNGAYMQRMSYLRVGHDDAYYEIGRWSLSGDGHTLTLDGGGKGNVSWAVRDARTLRKLDRQDRPFDSKLPYDLTRRNTPESMEPRVQLSGMFRYLADAPMFRDCGSRLEWPVSMSGDFRSLERVYSARRAAPGSELMVSLNVRIEQRPRMEGKGTEQTLVVERFIRAMPGERCKEMAPQAGLVNTRWRPVRIGDRAVVVSGQEREPWIELDSKTKRVTGSGGCNRIAGGYFAGDGTLRFGQLLSTKMACPMLDTETAFLRALTDTRRYRVRDRNLELLDDGGRVLAKLEEREL